MNHKDNNGDNSNKYVEVENVKSGEVSIEHNQHGGDITNSNLNNINTDTTNINNNNKQVKDNYELAQSQVVDPVNFKDVNFEIDNSLQNVNKQGLTGLPTKILILSIFLLVTGVSFLIAGLASLVGNDDSSKTISFLVLGGFLSIPGIYYTIQLWQAYIAETPEERQEILGEIPIQQNKRIQDQMLINYLPFMPCWNNTKFQKTDYIQLHI